MELSAADWLIRIAVATALCGLVGFEREAANKQAGLRTNMLVGLGATVFTLISVTGFEGADTSRVAAQIVTGVGFLGAGAIFRHGTSITGLTTAASLWVVAAIGLACGAGELGIAGAATAAALVVLYGLRVAERIMRQRAQRKGALLEVGLRDMSAVGRVLKATHRLDPKAEVARFHADPEIGGSVCLRVDPGKVELIGAVLHSIEAVDRTVQVDN